MGSARAAFVSCVCSCHAAALALDDETTSGSAFVERCSDFAGARSGAVSRRRRRSSLYFSTKTPQSQPLLCVGTFKRTSGISATLMFRNDVVLCFFERDLSSHSRRR